MTHPTQPQRQAPKEKSDTARVILIAAGGVLLLLLLLGSCVGLFDGGEDAAAPASPVPSPAAATTAASEETTEPEPEPANCKPLKKSQISEIAPGMDRSTRVRSGVWVPLTEEYRFGFNQVIALRLSGGSVATFAAENLGKSDSGLLMAVNGPARKHFTWGAAVNPGSPMDDDLQAVKDSLEYTDAVGCARGQA